MTTNKQTKQNWNLCSLYQRHSPDDTLTHVGSHAPTNGTKQVREEENTVYNNAVKGREKRNANKQKHRNKKAIIYIFESYVEFDEK